ncbi:hypothetical protein ACTA71_004010 [Dictyostelium dimigraforme]
MNPSPAITPHTNNLSWSQLLGQFENKPHINNFSSLPPSICELIMNPSPLSKEIPIINGNNRVDSVSIPKITSEIPSLFNAASLQHLPKGRGKPVPLPSVYHGPSDGVVFSQVYDQSKNHIAIIPNIPDPYDTSNYGEYNLTIFDESGEKVILKSMVCVNPAEAIILPKKFDIKTPLGEPVYGSVELFNFNNEMVFQGTVRHGCANLPQNLLDGAYEIKIKPNLDSLLPLSFKMVVCNSERTDSSNLLINRMNNPDEMDFILVWDKAPSDLDSHIWCIHPNGTIDHVYFGKKVVGNMSLQHDVMHGNGPETITFKRLNGCKYVYAVHKYSNEGELAQSKARIRINHEESTLFERSIPNTQQNGARFWIVCTMDGTSGDITFKDHFEFHNNSNDIPLKYK